MALDFVISLPFQGISTVFCLWEMALPLSRPELGGVVASPVNGICKTPFAEVPTSLRITEMCHGVSRVLASPVIRPGVSRGMAVLQGLNPTRYLLAYLRYFSDASWMVCGQAEVT